MELAREIIRLTGSSSTIIFKELPEDDPMQRKPDIRLAREILNNWEPTIELEQGLLKVIAYFKEVLAEG